MIAKEERDKTMSQRVMMDNNRRDGGVCLGGETFSVVESQMKNKIIPAEKRLEITENSYFQAHAIEHNGVSRGLWMMLAGINIYFVGVNILNTNKGDTVITVLSRVTMGVGLLKIAGSLIYFIMSKVESERVLKTLESGGILRYDEMGIWKTVMLGIHTLSAAVLFLVLLVFVSLGDF